MSSSRDDQVREGEITLPFDPAEKASGPRLMFIGHIESPWPSRADCPRNITEARQRMRQQGLHAFLHVDEPFRPGLQGLGKDDNIIVLYWMHQAARHIIIQRPRHTPGAHGVFALRSPVRPNNISLSTVRVLHIDQPTGIIEIDAIDCLNCTPLLDIRPWTPQADLPEDYCVARELSPPP